MPILRFPDFGFVPVLFISLFNLLPEDRRIVLASIFDTLHEQCVIIIETALRTVTVFTNTAFRSVACIFDKMKETFSAEFTNLDSADLNIVYKKNKHTFLLVNSYLCRIVKRIILSKLKLFRKRFDFLDWDFPTRTLRRSRNEDIPELLKKACEEGYLTESDLVSSMPEQHEGNFVNKCCGLTLSVYKENESFYDSHSKKIREKREKHETVKTAFMPILGALYKYPLFPKIDRKSSSGGTEAKSEAVQTTKYPSFSQYSTRLATFRYCYFHANRELFARLGFFCQGYGDAVCCYQCGVALSHWSEDHDPLLEHIRYSPYCAHLTRVTAEESLISCREQVEKRRGPESSNRQTGDRRDILQAKETYIHGGIHQDNSTSLRSPAFQSSEIRLFTFGKFPISNGISIGDLANAGFYYTGVKDKVRCFWCGVGLLKWEYGDDPYWKHARYNPNCFHLRRIKGQRFVEYVQEKEKQNQRLQDATKATAGMSSQLEDLSGRPEESIFRAHRHDALSTMTIRDELLSFEDESIQLPKDNDDFQNNKGITKERKQNSSKTGCTIEQSTTQNSHEKFASETKARELERLLNENKMLTSIVICKRCRERQRTILLLPCKHFFLCDLCSKEVSLCPECQKPVRERVKTYIS